VKTILTDHPDRPPTPHHGSTLHFGQILFWSRLPLVANSVPSRRSLSRTSVVCPSIFPTPHKFSHLHHRFRHCLTLTICGRRLCSVSATLPPLHRKTRLESSTPSSSDRLAPPHSALGCWPFVDSSNQPPNSREYPHLGHGPFRTPNADNRCWLLATSVWKLCLCLCPCFSYR
jgi:hypothetical protein